MSWMCVSRVTSAWPRCRARRARIGRRPQLVTGRRISGRIFFHAQPADHAPCATTKFAMPSPCHPSSPAKSPYQVPVHYRAQYTVPPTNTPSGESMPPFRAEHVGSLLRRPALWPRARSRGGPYRGGCAAAHRGRGGASGRAHAGGNRPARRDRRRIPPRRLADGFQVRHRRGRAACGRGGARSVQVGDRRRRLDLRAVQVGRLHHKGTIFGADFTFLKSVAKATPKSPCRRRA